MKTTIFLFLLLTVLAAGLNPGISPAAEPGLPFTEDFTDSNLKDSVRTTANWSTEEEALLIHKWQRRYGVFTSGTTVVVDIASDADWTLAVALGDINGDGHMDVVAGNSGDTNRLYLNNGTADPFSDVIGQDITMDSHSTRSVALGDVDGDGDLDVVAGNASGETNRLYLNNGTADPFSGVTGQDITSDIYDTRSVALGDMDGDGDLDLVAGNAWEVVNRLYLNNGTVDPFSGVTGQDITPDTDWTSSIALGDVDGDGDLDVLAGNRTSKNRLYLNNGSAAPFEGVSGKNISADTHWTNAVALGDMDGDGDLDVVAGNADDGYGPQANCLYLNNGTTDPFSSVTGAVITTDGHATYSIALGDIDGDGDLDVLVGNDASANRLYLNNGTAAPFDQVTGYDISGGDDGSISIALADMDEDGDLDVVAGNINNQVNQLYMNSGSANPFSGGASENITADVYSTWSITLGDVDGDGDVDVVTGNHDGPNRLYLNNGTQTPFSGVAGKDITSDANATFSVVLGDVDGDGDLDLLVGNTNDEVNRLYLNNGTADPFSGVSGVNITSDSHSTSSLALGDVDRDGDLDLVSGNLYGIYLYLNNGTADPFSGITSYFISTSEDYNNQSVALADIDSDGDLDIIVGNYYDVSRLYSNNGSSNPFDGVIGLDISSDMTPTFQITIDDVDSDGDLDLVEGNYEETNRLYLNNGTADPFSGVTGSDISSDTRDTRAITVGDVDGDGDLDVLSVGWDSQKPARLYLNNGTSAPFSNAEGQDITADGFLTAVALADMDQDGDLDIVAGDIFASRTNLLLKNNRSSLPFRGVTGTDITTDAHETLSVAIGDVNGDGRLDVAAANATGTNRLYLGSGGSLPFEGVSGTDITSDNQVTYAIALGDVDGDGDPDAAVGNNGLNRLYLNNGTADPFSGISGSDITSDNRDTRALLLQDLNGDGKLDVLSGNWGARNGLYLNNGTPTPFDGVTGSDVGAGSDYTTSLAAGDMDRDGDIDVVAGNVGSVNHLYLNSGTTDPFNGVNGLSITGDVHTTQALEVGDVDRDGDLDLVAGNDGVNRLYLNNGTSDPFNGVSGTDITSDDHDTESVMLIDLDGDGDLDLVAGNSDEPNRLYLNNGTADPFSGVTGEAITEDAHITYALAAGDLDRDGQMDLVAGNSGRNRLYRRNLYRAAGGAAFSAEVDDEDAENIAVAKLTPTETLPPHTKVDYFLSNNGGAQYFRVEPGETFTFPTSGMDLRWRAEMHTLSPVYSPRIDQIDITTNSPPDTPSAPAPGHGNEGVSVDAVLTWTGGDPDTGDLVGYDVYLDTVDPPLSKVSTDQPTTGYDPGGLSRYTTYFWKIVSRDDGGEETEGPVWQFTTLDGLPPSQPSSPQTAPSPGVWSNDNTVAVSWTAGTDGESGVSGYSLVWDTSATTDPDAVADTSGTSVISAALSDGGSHYFHVRTVDNEGNVSPTVHLGPFYIDTSVSPPAGLDLASADDTGRDPEDNITQSTSNLTVSGTAEDDAEVQLRDGGSPISGASATVTGGTFSIDIGLSEGSHDITAVQVDKAGNGSGPSSVLAITVDETPPGAPSGLDLAPEDDTGDSNADDITNQTSALTVSGGGEDNAEVHLYDGGSPISGATAVVTSGLFSKDLSLAAGAHSLTAVQTDLAGNASSASAPLALMIDTTPPAITADPPGGIYNTNKPVSLQSDEPNTQIYYNFGFGQWIEYSGSVSIENTSTLHFFGVDAAGNTASESSETYTIDKVPPEAPVIDPLDNVSQGTNPTPTFVWEAVADADHYVFEYADNADFAGAMRVDPLTETSYTLVYPLTEGGVYYWRVLAVDAAGNESDWSTATYQFIVESTVRKAIVVAGSGPYENNLWTATIAVADMAYQTLRHRGYWTDRIAYLSHQSTGENPEVDGPASNAALHSAVTPWAADADELVLFMHGHGGDGTFKMQHTESYTEWLQAEDLDGWLDEIQADKPDMKIFVVYDSCHSGSFLPVLMATGGQDRVLMTSAEADEAAWWVSEGLISFGWWFWSQTDVGDAVREAFLGAKDAIQFVSPQTPLLDANSNGVGNEKADNLAVSDVYIGFQAIPAGDVPIIGSVSPDQCLSGATEVTIYADDVEGTNPIHRVWAVVLRPDAEPGDPGEPVDLPEIELAQAGLGYYEGTCSGVTVEGDYRITVYAQDEDGLISEPMQTLVVKGGMTGDLDGDCDVDALDADIALQVLAGKSPAGIRSDYASSGSDVNGDGRIGLEEALFIQETLYGIR